MREIKRAVFMSDEWKRDNAGWPKRTVKTKSERNSVVVVVFPLFVGGWPRPRRRGGSARGRGGGEPAGRGRREIC